MIERTNLKFFKHEELACPETGEVKLGGNFGEKLDELRGGVGFPLKINSCCRSEAHNKKIGGHPKSLHVYDKPYHKTGGCIAADISHKKMTPEQQITFLHQAWARGWSIGIDKVFFHIDRRKDIGLEQTIYYY